MHMIQLKEKIINFLLINGKKSINEKKIRISFKKLNCINKKRVLNILQFIIYWASFIFKFSAKSNSSYFFVSQERLFFAIKQIIRFNFFENLQVYNKEFQIQKKFQSKFVLNKKLLHFYRWKF